LIVLNVKILIAAHKACPLPMDDIYLPIHVGKEGKKLELGFITDNTGDNISLKNDKYCELTALYWAWKNLEADYIGLVHYRRHFAGKHSGVELIDKVLNRNEVEKLLIKSDIILPNKRYYCIETIESHYAHSHTDTHIAALRLILKTSQPEYYEHFERVLHRTYAHTFNMFIMRRDLIDAYCTWLFPILAELDEKIDSSSYKAFDKRFLGRVSEMLLDAWIEKNGCAYTEIPVLHTEGQNWPKKIVKFLRAKFLRRAYS
jgi:hypothetical protein